MVVPVALPRPWRNTVRERARKAGTRVGRLLRPARAPLANLAASPLTFLACVAFSAAGFTWNVHVGLYSVVVALVYLEHVIADEE